MLILKNIKPQEIEDIQGGRINLLHDKLVEAEEKWGKQLMLGKEDHRHTQGVYCLLTDLLTLLPER
jgi:hypothetical protein